MTPPKIKIDELLLKYSRKYSFDIAKEAETVFNEVQTKSTISQIRLQLSIMPMAFSRFDIKNNSLDIFFYPGFLKPFYGIENSHFSIRYILKHEMQEAFENKPSRIKIASDKIFSAVMPFFDSNSPLFELEKTSEDLMLHSKNICIDVGIDRKIVLNENYAKGFLISHDILYEKRKLEIDKIKMERMGDFILINTDPYNLVYLILSAGRCAAVTSFMNVKGMCAYRCFISKFRTQFFNLIDTLGISSKYGHEIYSELINHKPSWKTMYENSKKLIDSLEKDNVSYFN